MVGASDSLIGLVDYARGLLRQETTHHLLRRLEGHTIVCGLGRKGLALVQRLRDKNAPPPVHRVVVIDESPRPDFTAECERLGAMVLAGDATRPETLLEARLGRAARLFAVCPDDATNCEIAAQVDNSWICPTHGQLAGPPGDCSCFPNSRWALLSRP